MATSNIHISWDGPFMPEERFGIRQGLSRAVLSGDVQVCPCGITIMLVARGRLPDSYTAQLACGCGSPEIERGSFLISLHEHAKDNIIGRY